MGPVTMHKALYAVTALTVALPLLACSGDESPSDTSPMAESVSPPESGSSSGSSSTAAPAQSPQTEQPPPPAQPEPAKPLGPATFYSVDFMNQLVAFSPDDLSKTAAKVAITGLEKDEKIVAVEVRASDKSLWAVGNTSRMYTIDPTTGVATSQSKSQFFALLNGSLFDLDYDAASDQFRLVSDQGQNAQISPQFGSIVAPVGKKLTYAAGDVNEPKSPQVSGIAFAKNGSLYGIDPVLDVLTLHTDVPNGVVTTIGSLGEDFGDSVGFDIIDVDGGKQTAYLVARPPGALASSLYTVDLSTGKASLVGPIKSAALHGLTHTR